MSAPLHVRFDDFEFDARDPVRPKLLRAGKTVRLKPQALQFLDLLLSGAGRVLTRDEIAIALWDDPNHSGLDDGINRVANEVRKALGDHPKNSRFITVVYRSGYRFIGSLENITQATALPRPAPAPVLSGVKRVSIRSGRIWWRVILAGAGVLLAILVTFRLVNVESGRAAASFCSSPTNVRIISADRSPSSPAKRMEVVLHGAGCSVEVYLPDNPSKQVPESVLRFFSDEDQRRALDIVAFLNQGGFSVKLEDVRRWATGKNLPKGLLEIWIAQQPAAGKKK